MGRMQLTAASKGTDVKKDDKKPSKWKPREARVTETPPEMYMASGANSNKQAPQVHGLLTPVPGGVLVSFVKAETVRVAQYANVVIGPVGMSWVHGNIDMELLADFDWDAPPDEQQLSPEQQREYDKALMSLRVTGILVEHVIAEDRETVERSVRQYNEREAAEAAASASATADDKTDADDKPKRKPRQRTQSGRTRSRS
jgi:hypothetical protein